MPGKTQQATLNRCITRNGKLDREAQIVGTADGVEGVGGGDLAHRYHLLPTVDHPLRVSLDSPSSKASVSGVEVELGNLNASVTHNQPVSSQQQSSTYEHEDEEGTLSLSNQDDVQVHENEMASEDEQAESDCEVEEEVEQEEEEVEQEEEEVEEEDEYTDTEEDMESLPEELQFKRPFRLNLPPHLYWQLAYRPDDETITSVNSKSISEGEPIKEAKANGRWQHNADDALLSNDDMWHRLRDLCLLQRFNSINYVVDPIRAMERLKQVYRARYRKSGRKIPSILRPDQKIVAFINNPVVLAALPKQTAPVTDILQYFQRGAEATFYGQMGKEKKLQNPGLTTTISKYSATANDYSSYFHSNMPKISDEQINADSEEWDRRDKQRTQAMTKKKSWFQRVIVDTFAGGDDVSDMRNYRSQGRNWCVQNCMCCDSDQEDCC